MAEAPQTHAFESIRMYADPAWADDGRVLDGIRSELAAGRLVVIRRAFHSAFAERMYRALDASDGWEVHEKFDENFHYHHHNLYRPERFPADLAWCRTLFDSRDAKSLATALSGRQCDGPVVFSASWYLPGDHSLPHNDAVTAAASANRQVAFVWHLAKDWQSRWGGALFWCPRNLYVPPSFNTLVLFNVTPESYHFVTTVSPYAQRKRLAINGWWSGPSPTGNLPYPSPNQVEANPLIEVY